MGNYHDDTLETLADRGNGNYAYIDNLLEAKKVLVKEMAGTMYTLARDVKIQVEFNPALVGAYRLIGYENRALADEDFNDDGKDAGEIGVGHTVTALYELIPPGAADLPSVDPRRYTVVKTPAGRSDELLTVKLRYKPVSGGRSLLLQKPVRRAAPTLASTSEDFRFAAAVAGFGLILRDSHYRGTADYPMILKLARAGRGRDDEGYRAEFIRLVEMAQLIGHQSPSAAPVAVTR